MQKEDLVDLGRNFYEWHKTGKVHFVYSTDGKNFIEEIARISKLISYVEDKKDRLLKNNNQYKEV